MTLLRDTKLQWIKINEPRRKLISVSILVHRRFDRLRHDKLVHSQVKPLDAEISIIQEPA